LDVVALEADFMSVGLDWILFLLAGAVGGAVALLSAMTIRNAYGRRDRTSRPERAPATIRPPVRREKSLRAARTMRLVHSSSTASADAAVGAVTSSHLPPASSVIGYVTAGGDVGVGGDGESAIEAACQRSGWKLLEIVCEREERSTLDRRQLRHALERIADGQAQALVVSDFERLSRSIVELGALMAWFRDTGATLIALDLDVDTSTPEGQHVATTLIALSERDHQRIATGTRRGLAKARANGRPSGRPALSHRPELVQRIAEMRDANMTLSAIAEQLNAEGVPTLRGGKKWRPSSIQSALGYRRPSPRGQLPSPRAPARQ
jgi:DNA invertase Pin-like site-specific DNA recombinase